MKIAIYQCLQESSQSSHIVLLNNKKLARQLNKIVQWTEMIATFIFLANQIESMFLYSKAWMTDQSIQVY